MPLPVVAAIAGLSVVYLAAAEGLKHVAMQTPRRGVPIHR